MCSTDHTTRQFKQPVFDTKVQFLLRKQRKNKPHFCTEESWDARFNFWKTGSASAEPQDFSLGSSPAPGLKKGRRERAAGRSGARGGRDGGGQGRGPQRGGRIGVGQPGRTLLGRDRRQESPREPLLVRLGAGSAPDVSPGLPPQPEPARPPRALLPPLPHCYIPRRVSSAVRTASLLLWSNNFAWARLFRELVGSAGTQQLPPSFLLPLPAGTARQPQAPTQQHLPPLAPGRWFPFSLPPR